MRALWLAERLVCMRVCKHGCSVKMLCFSHANHASTNLKKFSSLKLNKFTLFTHSFVGWNLENRYKKGVSFFFRLSWHFKREKPVFFKASFLQKKDWLRAQASNINPVQDYATGKISLLINAVNKRVLLFSRESYLIKPIENVFPVFELQGLRKCETVMQTHKTYKQPTNKARLVGQLRVTNLFAQYFY